MPEVWAPITGVEGYEVSSHGRVKSLAKTWYSGRKHSKKETKPETIMAPSLTKGVLGVVISKRLRVVSRLVAGAFIPNPEGKPFVDHIDGDIHNNHVSNLRWATNQENQMNRGLMKTNTTGYPNANLENGRYRSRVTVDGKKVSLGYFETPEEAYLTAVEFKQRLYGDFVRLVN